MLTQTQTQKQQLKILPQQIQLLNLYFLNTIELEQRMKNELEENPFLEQKAEETFDEGEAKMSKDAVQDFADYDEFRYNDAPDYKADYQNYFGGDNAPEMPIVSTTHFKDDAKTQLRLLDLSERQMALGEYLIDTLDHHGLIQKDLDEVADDLSFYLHEMVDVEEIRDTLAILHTLDPIGLGSDSIQQCLLLQLEQMDHSNTQIRNARRLVKSHYNDLMHRQFERIYHALGIGEDELRGVLNIIGALKFYPVSEQASGVEAKSTIIPDFIVTRHGDALQAHLYTTKASSIFVNQNLYDTLSGQVSPRDRGAAQYVKSKLQSAQWFANAVKQREDTMMRIMNCILQFQQEYFMEGDIRLLKPMVLRMVAEKSGMDISTVSRITSNKYADTHFGLIYLKDLFSEGIADKKGEVISNKVIQNVIMEAISNEDKKRPYTDQQLVNILGTQGYNIARRTVAKYREQLQIPIAQIRAVWA